MQLPYPLLPVPHSQGCQSETECGHFSGGLAALILDVLKLGTAVLLSELIHSLTYGHMYVCVHSPSLSVFLSLSPDLGKNIPQLVRWCSCCL